MRPALPVIILVLVLGLITVGLLAWHLVSIQYTGLPLGSAARTPEAIVQIIHTQERHLPRLHRQPARDRYRLDLLVVQLADPDRARTIPLLRQQRHDALQPMTKILGAEGDVVWLQALDLFAVNLRTGTTNRLRDFVQANPELEIFLAGARFQFAERLLAIAPDGRQAYALDPDTRRAQPSPPPPRPTAAAFIAANNEPDSSLCSGGTLSDTVVIGALTAGEARDHRPGSGLSRDFPYTNKNDLRQIHRIVTEPAQPRRPIISVEPLSPTQYPAAAFIRSAPGGPILRLDDPDSVVLLHRSSAEASTALHLARLSTAAAPLWTTATGIGRLMQVLPASDRLALIGERPATAARVPEPILVLVDPATGESRTVSLWR